LSSALASGEGMQACRSAAESNARPGIPFPLIIPYNRAALIMPSRPRVAVLCNCGRGAVQKPAWLASPLLPLPLRRKLQHFLLRRPSIKCTTSQHHTLTPPTLPPPPPPQVHSKLAHSKTLPQIQHTMVSSRRGGGRRASRQASPSSSSSCKVLGVLALIAAAAQAFFVPSVPSAASSGMATTGPRTPCTCLCLFVCVCVRAGLCVMSTPFLIVPCHVPCRLPPFGSHRSTHHLCRAACACAC